MRFALIFLAACSCAVALEIPTYRDKINTPVENKSLLFYQKELLDLFKCVNQPTILTKYIDVGKTYSIEANMDKYMNPTAVKKFLFMYNVGMIPKNRVFSVLYKEHLKEAIALFKLFYYAKDVETLFKTAIWARLHMNEGMFQYALSVAVVQRPDTTDLVLPAIYEIEPYYFFTADVINKAQKYKQMYVGGTKYSVNMIQANYTGWYLNVHPEQSMSYFTEDVGLNAYYYYYHLFYPFWMGGEEFRTITQTWNRGEQFFYFYQQLMARYYMERLSNDMGEIPMFDWQTPFEIGYTPSLTYPNGLHFPDRTNWVSFFRNYYTDGQSITWKGAYPYSLTIVTDIERRIRDAIDRGYVLTPDGRKVTLYDNYGMEILGNLIQSNPDSPNSKYYGIWLLYARHMLGYSFQPLDIYKLAPSVLQHFETSLRDPAFWMLYKKMLIYFYKYKQNLPKYTYDELYFDGVKVEGVATDRLVTYFDYFDSDITNAVYMNEQEVQGHGFTALARQKRLNHKPFTFKIVVNSDKPVKSVVRVFIGPKYDEYGRLIKLNENRMNFFEIDKFVYDLQSGKNVIERNSRDLVFAEDMTTYKQIYQMVMGVGVGDHDMKTLVGKEVYYGFPQRFILPIGKVEGQVFQLFVIVSPYRPATTKTYNFYTTMRNSEMKISDYMRDSTYDRMSMDTNRMVRDPIYMDTTHTTNPRYTWPTTTQKKAIFAPWSLNIDDYPLGYPFDRYIFNRKMFSVPNSYFQDIVIYHKTLENINTVTTQDYHVVN